MPELIAVVCTHTSRSLRRTLLGLLTQQRRADRVVVSTDGIVPEAAAEIQSCADEWNMPITLVERAHAGIARSGQVRNNALRGLDLDAMNSGENRPSPDARLVFFDGDMFATPTVLAAHDRALAASDATIAWRVDLTAQQTEVFDERATMRGEPPILLTREQRVGLVRQHNRVAKYATLRSVGLHRLGLIKPHKPTILGANFGISLRAMRAINGFDERFEGYGQEDDDLARRLHLAGFRCAVIIRDCLNLHLWHPTRAPIDWKTSPTVAMLHQPCESRCVEGLDAARAQSELRVHQFGPCQRESSAPRAVNTASAGTIRA